MMVELEGIRKQLFLEKLLSPETDPWAPMIEGCYSSKIGTVKVDSEETPCWGFFEAGRFQILWGDYQGWSILELKRLLGPKYYVYSMSESIESFAKRLNAKILERYHFGVCELDIRGCQSSLKNKDSYELISIRSLSSLNALLKIDRNAFGIYKTEESFRKYGIGVIARNQEAEVVAFSVTYAASSTRAEIQVAVLPNHRGQGLAKATSEVLIKEAKEKGIQCVWNAANEASRNLAKKIGFLRENKYQVVRFESED